MSLSVLARKTRAKQNTKYRNAKCSFTSHSSIRNQGYCNHTGCCNKNETGVAIDKCALKYNMSRHVSYQSYLRRKTLANSSSENCCKDDKCEEINLGCDMKDKITGKCLKGCSNKTNFKPVNTLKSSDITDIYKKRAIYCNVSSHIKSGYEKCVDGACLPYSNVSKSTCVQYNCAGECNSKPRVSYKRINNSPCTYTKDVNVAGAASVGIYNAINRRTNFKKC